MRFLGAGGLLLVASFVAGCEPVPVHKAEEACAEEYRPDPMVGMTAKAGLSNGKPARDFEIEVSPGVDFGDPSARYAACVQRRSGQFPTRPLYELGGP